MTYEEAIRKINSQKLQFLEEYVDYGGTSKAYDMAIEALEKQIPKKVIWKFGGDGLPYPYCSACGNSIMRSDYCDNCGQRLEVRKRK